MNQTKIIVKRVHPLAKLPQYAHGPKEDACADLFSVEEVVIQPGESYSVDTGLQVDIPSGKFWDARPRSGMAFKHGVTLVNSPGTIDPGYRGTVKVGLINHGRQPYQVKVGERIAQVRVASYDEQIYEEGELSESVRGDGGFGSSGR